MTFDEQLFFYILLRNRLQEQETTLAKSQTCVQELTTELRNRCLELRELNQRIYDEEKLLQVRDEDDLPSVLYFVD